MVKATILRIGRLEFDAPLVAPALVALSCMTFDVSAQFDTDFEPPLYAGRPSGQSLTGQQGWFLPVAGSTDWFATTYARNTLGLPQNPQGAGQFVVGVGQGGGTFARAQKNVSLGAGTWTLGADIAVAYLGTLPAPEFIGSLSTQPGFRSARLIMLPRWSSRATATSWNADIFHYNAAGNQVTSVVPNPRFQNLQIRHWYKWSSTFDFVTNRIVEVSIEDLTSGLKVTHNPVDWYLEGGSAGTLPVPTAIRLFAGGDSSVFGNMTAFDNVFILPDAPSCPCACDFDPDPACNIFDFLAFQTAFVAGEPCACEFDPDPACNIFDFLAFQTQFVAGCP